MIDFLQLRDFVDKNHATQSKARIVCFIQLMEDGTGMHIVDIIFVCLYMIHGL